MASAFTLALPRFIVLSSNDRNDYMGYIREKNAGYGYLAFVETQVVSPYAKFEVEKADEDGLVHIRSCQNNKYWVRTKKDVPITGNWITSTAEKPENDQSKESCTLFKPILVDAAKNTFRIMHVQSGCYLCLWQLNNPVFSCCVSANYKVFDHQKLDIFKIIDWNLLVILPKFLAFRGDNGRYLCLHDIQDDPYLQFSADDITELTAAFENITTPDGTLSIKSSYNHKFWRRGSNWILADSSDDSSTNNDTLFRPVKVDNQTISLINLGNNHYCKRLSLDGNINCLNAGITSITSEAKLKVEELVSTRSIDNVKYDLENSRVYDEMVLVVAKNSATNNTQQAASLDVKLSYTDTRTSTWKTMFSLKLGMKATMDFSLPLILKGEIELSGEVQSGVEWGTTTTTTRTLEVVHKIVVPPMTKVTVDLIATNGKCDVPFTFTERDTLYNGTTVTTEVQGGTYTGSNYYNIDFQTKEEKI